MKLIKFASILILAFSMTHCYKSEDGTTLRYHQTQCADPWQSSNSNSDELVIATLRNFFETEYQIDINAVSLSFDNNIAEACRACDCLSGGIITVTVEDQFSDEFEAEGFFIP